jgi:hypothetical protein
MNGLSESIEISYNNVWDNVAGDYRDMDELTGAGGNISLNPSFVDSLGFHLSPESPCLDAGNPIFTDPDGGPSDIGIHGGPAAR